MILFLNYQLKEKAKQRAIQLNQTYKTWHKFAQPGYFLEEQLMISLHSPKILKGFFKKDYLGFPGGAVVKNLPANAGDRGSCPGLGRSHMPRSN